MRKVLISARLYHVADSLLSLAGKIDPAIRDFITQTPSMPQFLRRMKEKKMSPAKIDKIMAEMDKNQDQ